MEERFEARVRTSNKDIFHFDWVNVDTGNLSTSYLVDLKKGYLIIYGDSDCCIASWFHRVELTDVKAYLRSQSYFVEKILTSERLYTYNNEDVEEDIEDLRKDALDEGIYAEDEINQDFDEMKIIYEGYYREGKVMIFDEMLEYAEKYGGEGWYDTSWADLGMRLDPRIDFWRTNFIKALDELGIE